MKVIDIMQKVANKEIFKFKIDGELYYVDKSNYICEQDGNRVEWYIDDDWLNMGAEIIEEDKKIEKIRQLCEYPHTDIYECWDIKEEMLVNKINEIIDKINEMEDK